MAAGVLDSLRLLFAGVFLAFREHPPHSAHGFLHCSGKLGAQAALAFFQTALGFLHRLAGALLGFQQGLGRGVLGSAVFPQEQKHLQHDDNGQKGQNNPFHRVPPFG